MNDQQQVAATAANDDDRYADFLSAVRSHFSATVAASPRLFVTDAANLWETYLDSAPATERQTRTCNTCRYFIRRFGGLVSISEAGRTTSAVWPEDAPPLHVDATRALKRLAERADVVGVFRAKEATWGTPTTGPWTHLSLRPPLHVLSTSVVETPAQEMAAKREEYAMLLRGLAEFPVDVVRQAVAVLESEALYRSEKVLGGAKWLLDVHARRAAAKSGRYRDDLTWLAVAGAPPGFCHVRSSMIGTLLEDLVAGLPFDAVKRRFSEKMHPLQYQRPQAAPSAGNIAQAEKIVEALRSAGGLERRYAKLADIETIWLPTASATEPRAPTGGVFGHLAPRESKQVTTSIASSTTMTWVKFRSIVLTGAESIEFLVPHQPANYTAMVTAKNADALNLLQWDNPVSHYVRVNGSLPSEWNLVAGRFHRVTAVSLRSWMWGAKPLDHHGAGVVFVLDGARDVAHERGGGMFPEQMKSEYHAVRRTLEAYFKNAAIEGRDEAEACGIALVKGFSWDHVFRVESRGILSAYKLDRWD